MEKNPEITLILAETSTVYGLREDWAAVQKALEDIIPVYDKTNRYISFGSDVRLRKKGLDLLRTAMGNETFSVVDLGCGTGRMTQLFLDSSGPHGESPLLVDPIAAMMRVAKKGTRSDGLLAVFENLPFRSGSLDSAMAGFSLRDARNLGRALDQINYLLKPGGKFLIVDLSKPDSKVGSALITIYWKVLAPLVAFCTAGRLGLKFGALATTYTRLPTISQFFEISKRSGFGVIASEFSMLGGASVIILGKGKETTS